MQSPTHDERAAKALATAAVLGDGEAAKRHGCSTRSLRRWRKQCEDDPELAAAVRREKSVIEAEWAEQVPGALRKALAFMERAFVEMSPTDPDALHAVAGAFKLLTEAETTRRVLDVRLARATGSTGAQPLKVVAGGRAD